MKNILRITISLIYVVVDKYTMDSDLCEICEEDTAVLICYTCVNPVIEVDLHRGVVMCQSCQETHHNRGIFLKHQVQSLTVKQNRELLKSEITEFKNSAVTKIHDEIVKMNVKMAINKANADGAKRAIHLKLMEVYNFVNNQLNAKEKDLNHVVDVKMNEIREKTNSLRESLKDLSTSVNKDTRNLLESLASDEITDDTEQIKLEFKSLEDKVRDTLVCDLNVELGPYVDVDLGLFEREMIDIKSFQIAQMKFYSAKDIIEDSSSVLPDLFISMTEDFEYVIPREFINRAMLNHSRASLRVPHPGLVKHGKWILNALEYHLKLKYEQNKLISVMEQELECYERCVVIAKSQASELPQFFRCRYSMQDHDEKRKSKRKLDKGPKMVTIHPVDHYDLAIKTIFFNKVTFYKMDPCLENIPSLVLKIGFNGVETVTSTIFPELSSSSRQRLQKLFDHGMEMKVMFNKQLTFLSNEYYPVWASRVTVDGTDLATMLIDDEVEVSKPKLCQDIRAQRDGNLPIVREILARPSSETNVKKELLGSQLQVDNNTDGKASTDVTASTVNSSMSSAHAPESLQSLLLIDPAATATIGHASEELSCLKINEPTKCNNNGMFNNSKLQSKIGEKEQHLPSEIIVDRICDNVTDVNSKLFDCALEQSEVLLHGGPIPPSTTGSFSTCYSLAEAPPVRNPPVSSQLSPNSQEFLPKSLLRQLPTEEVWNPNVLHWDNASSKSLRYLTLIIFGEDSNEFLNSLVLGEPPAEVKRTWAEFMRLQQRWWSSLPQLFFQQTMEREMQKFPDLHEEFRRFQVPMNASRLSAYTDQPNTYSTNYSQLQDMPPLPLPSTAADSGCGDAWPTGHNGNFNIPHEMMQSHAAELHCSQAGDHVYTNGETPGSYSKPTADLGNGTNSFEKEENNWEQSDGKSSRKTENSSHDYYQRSLSQGEDRLSSSPVYDDSDWLDEEDAAKSSLPVDSKLKQRSVSISHRSQVCYYCHQVGHIQMRCPKYKQDHRGELRSNRRGRENHKRRGGRRPEGKKCHNK